MFAVGSGHSALLAVSPEFILRPSLSEHRRRQPAVCGPVSPEFILRPSLSGDLWIEDGHFDARVSPEFILRPSLSGVGWELSDRGERPVSPEFILRPSLSDVGLAGPPLAVQVSPEFILRPSLSGDSWDGRRRTRCGCRRSLYSGLR